MVRLLPQYRGVRIKPYMRHMNYILFGFFFLLFCGCIILYVFTYKRLSSS